MVSLFKNKKVYLLFSVVLILAVVNIVSADHCTTGKAQTEIDNAKLDKVQVEEDIMTLIMDISDFEADPSMFQMRLNILDDICFETPNTRSIAQVWIDKSYEESAKSGKRADSAQEDVKFADKQINSAQKQLDSGSPHLSCLYSAIASGSISSANDAITMGNLLLDLAYKILDIAEGIIIESEDSCQNLADEDESEFEA